jgi:signal-transduction protein with cAMP-binding, CBS, and nucleotidyltransferase domain
MSADAALWYLRQVDLFAGMPDEEMERISTVTALREYRRGHLILGERHHPSHLFIVKRGRVKLALYSPVWGLRNAPRRSCLRTR